jgi:lysophospholipase L1-like esterase
MSFSPHLLFIGDSVTDCGRARPIGNESPASLGHGYVALVDAGLRARNPGQSPRVTNMGIGGDTTRDLLKRWDTDVIALRPDWLSVMIGINDVWRYFDPIRKAEAVPPDEFRENLENVIARTLPRSQRLVLMTPFYVEPERAKPMRVRMDAFGAIVADLARQHGASGFRPRPATARRPRSRSRPSAPHAARSPSPGPSLSGRRRFQELRVQSRE